MDCLEDELRAELLGRFHQIVIFKKLSVQAQIEIVRLQYLIVKSRLTKLGHEISLTEQELELLTRKAITNDKGARNVRNVVERELQARAREAFKKSLLGIEFGLCHLGDREG